MIIKFVRSTGYVLLAIGGGVMLLNLVGLYMEQGWSGVQELQTPGNIWYYATAVVVLAPGALFIMLADKIEERRRRLSHQQ